MKAIVIHRYGGPEELMYEEAEEPAVGPGQVLVHVVAASVNPIDAMQRSGVRKDAFPIRFPGVIGRDLSGTVAAIGAGVDDFHVGDRVCALADHTYAELCLVKAELLAKVPDALDLVDAAAVPLVGLTGSEQVLIGGEVKRGDRVLVSGATGGVGRAAAWAAKSEGAIVIAGVSRRHVEEARSLGVAEVVALDDEAAFNALEPVDVVANTVRGATADQLMRKLTTGGRFVSVTGAPTNAADYPQIKVIEFFSRPDSALLVRLLTAVQEKALTIPVARRLALQDAAEAHRLLAEGERARSCCSPELELPSSRTSDQIDQTHWGCR